MAHTTITTASVAQGGWWILLEVDVELAVNDIVRPDLAYARVGVPYIWMSDPTGRTLDTLRLQDGAWVDSGSCDDTASVPVAPFEKVELEVARLFRLPMTS